MNVQFIFIAMFNIKNILGLYLESWWCFCDQKYAIGT